MCCYAPGIQNAYEMEYSVNAKNAWVEMGAE